MSGIALDNQPHVAPLWPVSLPEQTPLQESIHERHWHQRQTIIFALNDSYARHQQRRATRLAYCSNGASFFVDPATGKVRPWISRCHCRMCPYCARTRSRRVADQLLAILRKMTAPRMIILTVKSETAPLSRQLRFLRQSFAKLRRRKQWKTHVAGGAYTLEITRNAETGLWHPHLHLIVDGTYMPQKLLRNLWHQVTANADIVWIAAVSDRQGAARELAKYIGKPQRVTDFPPESIREYAEAVNGTRMVQTFGTFHAMPLEDRDDEEPESPDVYRVKISRLVHLAYRGADTPQRLLVLIADRWPQFRSYIYHSLPRLELPPRRTDRLARILKTCDGRGPPPTAAAATTIAKQQQDREIFLAFCRFRADDAADLFYAMEFQ